MYENMTCPEEAAIIQFSSAHLVVKSRALVCVVLQCELRSSVAGLAYVADQLAAVQARFNS